ncbi:hypothetical protein ACK1JC_02740 [Acinetobacter sp. TY2]|uniref:hypothetical protein n=1 Tax=unclassified Acinetobacter TaxID=196816 RepID=UPI00305A56D9
MKAMTKIVLVTASVISMGALTACQSTQGSKNDHHGRMMDRQDHNQHHNKMSPEQREEMKQMHAQRKEMREQIQKACDGKTVGQTIQVKVGQQSVDGTCNMIFKADRKAMKEMRKNMRDDANTPRPDHMRHGMHHGGMNQDTMLTDAKRAELTKQFDQRLAQRQVQQQAIFKACQGQSNGKTVQVKFGEQTVDGTCIVKFNPLPKAQNTASAPVASTATLKAS